MNELADEELESVSGGTARETKRLFLTIQGNQKLCAKMNDNEKNALDAALAGNGSPESLATIGNFLQNSFGLKSISFDARQKNSIVGSNGKGLYTINLINMINNY